MPRTTAQFSDCYRTMDQAIALGGARVEFPERKFATLFRHRCYSARALLLRSAKPGENGVPFTPYDDIVIRFESDFRPGGSERVLIFQLRSNSPGPKITRLDGSPAPEPELPNFDDLKIPGLEIE